MIERPVVHFRAEVHKAVAWGVVIATTLFGAMFVLGGLDALFGRSAAEGAILIVVGLAIAGFAWRLALHMFLPQITVSPNEMTIRKFWRGVRRWRFVDVAAWQVRTVRITRDFRGGAVPHPVRIERLVIKDRHGKEHTVTLPGRPGQNGALLALIADRSRKPVTAGAMTEN